MTTRSGSTVFSYLFGSSSKELDSDKFYDAMDSDFSNLDTYDNICTKILISRKKNEMIPICIKYLRFLDNYEVWGGTNTGYDVSLLLNYWLYDKISAIYGITDIDTISIDFSALQRIWDHFIDSSIRKPYYQKFKPNINIFKEEDWEKRKELYEYYVNYDNLFGTAWAFREKCEEYYGKIKKMILVYKYFVLKCSSESYKCPEVYNKCKKKNIESELEKLPCHAIIKAKSVSSLEGDSTHQSPSHAQRLPFPAGSRVDGPAAESDPQLESGNSRIGKSVAHSVLGAAPVLLTATALYRYTPLGPWIRRFGGGRTNNMNAMDTFSPYAQENGDMFSEETANYISYQPI